MCWGIKSNLRIEFTSYGNGIYSGGYTQTYPAQFIDDNIAGNVTAVIGTGAPWGNVRGADDSAIAFRILDIANRSNMNVDISWFAIGRWK